MVLSKLKDIIQDLYQVMVQVSTYDEMGRPSRDVLQKELTTLSQSLQNLHNQTTSDPLPEIPFELLDYVENGRNPDIYTREFVEMVRRANQNLAGKERAFANFRDTLAGEMERAMPELREDIGRVLEATGGSRREEGRNGMGTSGETDAKA
ncbi:transcription factor subunit med10 of mediator complex domain-containing protein [Sarocladium implicatum]|nr:transcription factor subunit med10 of mediator complex domain-containing protein [Sarocladium implicatum]